MVVVVIVVLIAGQAHTYSAVGLLFTILTVECNFLFFLKFEFV